MKTSHKHFSFVSSTLICTVVALWDKFKSWLVVLSDSSLLTVLNKDGLLMYLKLYKFSRWVTINDICKMSLNQSLLITE